MSLVASASSLFDSALSLEGLLGHRLSQAVGQASLLKGGEKRSAVLSQGRL